MSEEVKVVQAKRLDRAAVAFVKQWHESSPEVTGPMVVAELQKQGYVNTRGNPVDKWHVGAWLRRKRIVLYKMHGSDVRGRRKGKKRGPYKKAAKDQRLAMDYHTVIKAAAPKSTLLGDIEEIMTSNLAEGIKSKLIVTLVKQQYPNG